MVEVTKTTSRRGVGVAVRGLYAAAYVIAWTGAKIVEVMPPSGYELTRPEPVPRTARFLLEGDRDAIQAAGARFYSGDDLVSAHHYGRALVVVRHAWRAYERAELRPEASGAKQELAGPPG